MNQYADSVSRTGTEKLTTYSVLPKVAAIKEIRLLEYSNLIGSDRFPGRIFHAFSQPTFCVLTRNCKKVRADYNLLMYSMSASVSVSAAKGPGCVLYVLMIDECYVKKLAYQ